jgi:4,5-DOPA dioxygenase extradiol
VLPAVFISHGSPMVALESDAYTLSLRAFGERFPAPQAVLVISAHWEAPAPLRLPCWETAPVIHDFGGFPKALYELDYPAPGSPGQARSIAALLESAGLPVSLDPGRGLDHGAWVPLRHMYPDASIPTLQLSLQSPASPEELVAVGRALRPLRSQGVLIIGSGGIVHNLRAVRFHDRNSPVDGWAAAFDEWIAARLAAREDSLLLDYLQLAPHARFAVPATDHFHPLFCVLGAAEDAERPVDLHSGFQYGNLSMRSFFFGARGGMSS